MTALFGIDELAVGLQSGRRVDIASLSEIRYYRGNTEFSSSYVSCGITGVILNDLSEGDEERAVATSGARRSQAEPAGQGGGSRPPNWGSPPPALRPREWCLTRIVVHQG